MLRRLMFAALLPVALAVSTVGASGGGTAGSGLACVPPPIPDPTFPEPADLSDAKNAAFLATYDAQPDVVKTASGLRYRVLVAGSGTSAHPKPTDTVLAHYRGSYIDGTVFDVTACNFPQQLPLLSLIPGWQEGIPLMKEGDVYEFVVPYELGYGEQGRPGSIPPRQTLVFQVDLLKIR